MRNPLLLLCAMACQGPDTSNDTAQFDMCANESAPQYLLVRKATFARGDALTLISEGFDLDGTVTGPTDLTGCGVEDYTSPSGVPGIDNSIARLLPILETTEAAAIEPIIQDSINGGALLLMFGLHGVDDPLDDTCVQVEVLQGVGDPFVGADGWIVPGQTFDRDGTNPIQMTDVVPLVDGVVQAGPLEADMAFQVLDAYISFTMHTSMVQMWANDNGTWSGRVAGGVEIDALVAVATEQNVDPAVFELIDPVLKLAADLGPDETGTCTQLSMTLEFEAVSAFLFDQP